MGWHTDWLYQLVFDEIAALWSKAKEEGKGEFGPSPAYILIQECASADWYGFIGCIDPVIKQWRFDDTGLESRDANAEVPKPALPASGMFFDVGKIRFCIAPDRKYVTMTHVLGPRYGAGRIFEVSGQDRTGKLQPFGLGWIS